MTYDTLIKLIKAEYQNDYYELILTHSQLIMEEIGKTNKANIAHDLNMKPTQFSIAYKYILAHHNISNREVLQPCKK